MFRSSICYHKDGPWYDWILVEYLYDTQSTSIYFPGHILGFVKLNKTSLSNLGFSHKTLYAVVQSSTEELSMSDIESHFISRFKLRCDDEHDYGMVEVASFAHPLFVRPRGAILSFHEPNLM